jgi:hypothetical protein
MHPQLTYLLALDRIHERVAQAERDRLRTVVSDAESADRRDRGRVVSLRAASRSRMSRRAAAEVADQR